MTKSRTVGGISVILAMMNGGPCDAIAKIAQIGQISTAAIVWHGGRSRRERLGVVANPAVLCPGRKRTIAGTAIGDRSARCRGGQRGGVRRGWRRGLSRRGGPG